ncbi:hypothetical protein PENTCL1PPCAC_12733, partial [Pristionchus entomophagus]
IANICLARPVQLFVMRTSITIIFLLLLPHNSSYSIVSPAKYLAVENSVLPHETSGERLRELRGRMGNTLYAVAVDVYDRWNDTDIHYKEALFNGVLCEFFGDYEQEITQLLYGDSTVLLSNTQREHEEIEALVIPILFNCSSFPGDKQYDDCFCTEEKVLLYCLILRLGRRIRDGGDRVFKLLNNEQSLGFDMTYQKKQCTSEALKSLSDHKTLF